MALGMFSAAFVGINALAFSSSTGLVENLPPITAPVVIPAEQTSPEGFKEPTLTVALGEHQMSEPSANALSKYDAARIGAQYIWEMFGECIDGKYVTLWYSVHPSHTRAYWRGNVSIAPFNIPNRIASEDEDMEALREARMLHIRQQLFSFAIDAVTGEWIDISRLTVSEMSDEVRNAIIDADPVYLYNLRSAGAAPVQIDEHSQIAVEHAARHFASTEVVNVEFMGAAVSGFGLDENGNLSVTSRVLMFDVTDSTGRVANVTFDEATGRLSNIITAHNDIVPGFAFSGPGLG